MPINSLHTCVALRHIKYQTPNYFYHSPKHLLPPLAYSLKILRPHFLSCASGHLLLKYLYLALQLPNMSIKRETPANLRKTFALIFFTTYLLLVSMLANAQTITFAGGPSIPTGLYGSSDLTQDPPGLALTGYHCTIILEENRKSRLISPFIQFTYNANKINDDVSIQFYKVLDPANVGFNSFKPWSQSLLLAGPKFQYFGNCYDIYLKGGIGIGWLSTFGYTLLTSHTIIVPGDTVPKRTLEISKYNVLKDNSICYSVGLGTNIYLNECLSVCFGYEIFYAGLRFKLKTNFK